MAICQAIVEISDLEFPIFREVLASDLATCVLAIYSQSRYGPSQHAQEMWEWSKKYSQRYGQKRISRHKTHTLNVPQTKNLALIQNLNIVILASWFGHTVLKFDDDPINIKGELIGYVFRYVWHGQGQSWRSRSLNCCIRTGTWLVHIKSEIRLKICSVVCLETFQENWEEGE